MSVSEQVDVVVVGLGTGGEELGGRLAMAGLDVVGIEPELVGGECAYWACIPTKMMIRAANLLQEARRVDGMAGHADVSPDWTQLATRIREQATADWDDSIAVKRFEGRGGTFVRGRGSLSGPNTVRADGRSFEASRGIVIATGSRPIAPPIPGLDDVGYWTSRDAVSAPELPASLLIIGGGAVGCELGQVFARFGSRVTIVEGSDRLLSAEEPAVGALLGEVFEREGIDVRTGRRVEEVRRSSGSIVARLSDGTELSSERLLVAVGRRPALDGLTLEAAGIDVSTGHVPVDDDLRAGDGVWAMGDVTGKALFTHRALAQAPVVEAGILGREPPKIDYTAFPRATFTDPEVGAVGMTEADARAAGIDVTVSIKQVGATFRGWIHGTGNDGFIKLVVDAQKGVIVGATSVGPAGAEVLGLLTAAIHARLPMGRLGDMIYAFPTFFGGVGEMVGAYGRALVQVMDPEAEFLLER